MHIPDYLLSQHVTKLHTLQMKTPNLRSGFCQLRLFTISVEVDQASGHDDLSLFFCHRFDIEVDLFSLAVLDHICRDIIQCVLFESFADILTYHGAAAGTENAE